ncbi:MAG: CDP-alcohol phosphatidyltransferase family protein [Bacteroidetes bacterium]|nr:CDP-alcohol phosphatidyltransferase family protein [Bacteroidota bacterium]
MKIKAQIPNIITLSGLFCGFVGILSITQGSLFWAAWAVMAAAFLDVWDGLTARILHVQSKMGEQLDSLCDLVNFGVLPTLIASQMFHQFAAAANWFPKYKFGHEGYFTGVYTISFLLFIYLAGAVIRLAKFNVSHGIGFSGLPSPAAGMFVAAVPLIYYYGEEAFPLSQEILNGVYGSALGVFTITIIVGIFMVLPIPLLSFKGMNSKPSSYIF